MHRHSHAGAKQPHIFSHEKAGWLDEPEREGWLPTPTLLGLLEVAPGMRVLDFGAGTGRYALALAEQQTQIRVVAYDVQPEFLAIIAQRIAERGLANVRASDRVEGRFDRIFALNVLFTLLSLFPLFFLCTTNRKTDGLTDVHSVTPLPLLSPV